MRLITNIFVLLTLALFVSSCGSDDPTDPGDETPNSMKMSTDGKEYTTDDITFSKLFSQVKGTYNISGSDIQTIGITINIPDMGGIPKVGEFGITGFYNETRGNGSDEVKLSWAYGDDETCTITSVSGNIMVGTYSFSAHGVSSDNLETMRSVSGSFEVEY